MYFPSEEISSKLKSVTDLKPGTLFFCTSICGSDVYVGRTDRMRIAFLRRGDELFDYVRFCPNGKLEFACSSWFPHMRCVTLQDLIEVKGEEWFRDARDGDE